MFEKIDLSEYADPAIYDAEGGGIEPEASFYRRLANQAQGPVLELGCGTGRITIPLAEEGIDITGLDIVPQMLQRGKSKAKDLPINWVEADVRTFHLDTQFQLIFTAGGVFQHLLNRSDQEAMLARVLKHLAPEGRFAFDSWFKRPESIVNVPEEQDWDSYVNEEGQDVRVSGTDHYDLIKQIWYQSIYRSWCDSDGKRITHRATLALRYLFPQEIEALLHYNGFKVLERFGDFAQRQLTEDANYQVYICAKR